MGLFSFGGRVKPKKFDYIPRHYDPAKEELEAILGHQIDQSKEVQAELVKKRISRGLRMKSRGAQNYRKKETRTANIRLLVIVISLGFITYKILQSDAFYKMLDTFLQLSSQ